MNMAALKNELIRDEGLRLKVYKDSEGIETIGVGRNLQKGITREEAMYLLGNDVKNSIADANTFPWFEDLSDVRQRVVVNMIFNMGLNKFRGFKQTIKHIAAGEYSEAAKEMLDSKWAGQVGLRAVRLSQMMRTNEDYV
jgi:lysozyme